MLGQKVNNAPARRTHVVASRWLSPNEHKRVGLASTAVDGARFQIEYSTVIPLLQLTARNNFEG